MLLREVRDRLLAQHAPISHIERLADLVSVADASGTCIAIALVGSYAKGSGDRVSDLDLVMFVSEGAGRPMLDKAHDVLMRHPVLDQFAGDHAGGGSFRKYVYLDFSSVELHVVEPQWRFGLRKPYLPVWDPTRMLATRVVTGAPARHEDFPAYEYGDAGLIWELVDCIKWLSRGRTALAKNHLRKLVAAMDASDA